MSDSDELRQEIALLRAELRAMKAELLHLLELVRDAIRYVPTH